MVASTVDIILIFVQAWKKPLNMNITCTFQITILAKFQAELWANMYYDGIKMSTFDLKILLKLRIQVTGRSEILGGGANSIQRPLKEQILPLHVYYCQNLGREGHDYSPWAPRRYRRSWQTYMVEVMYQSPLVVEMEAVLEQKVLNLDPILMAQIGFRIRHFALLHNHHPQQSDRFQLTNSGIAYLKVKNYDSINVFSYRHYWIMWNLFKISLKTKAL